MADDNDEQDDISLLLFLMLMRHQIYLEGVKNWRRLVLLALLLSLRDDVRKIVLSYGDQPLNTRPKAQIAALAARLRKLFNPVLSSYVSDELKQLKKLTATDLALMLAIIKAADPRRGVPAADADAVWKKARNAPMPANGVTIEKTLQNFMAAGLANVTNLVQQSYANGDKPADLVKRLTGSGEQEGLLQQLARQGSAASSTGIQHASSFAQNAATSSIYARYVWVSVLDSRTSQICRSRNDKVYLYGAGPLPPAHINCRSKTVPLTEDANGTPPSAWSSSYWGFLKISPDDVQNDILGAARAAKLREGELKASDLDKFDYNGTLTLEQFAGKKKLITQKE